MSAYSDQADAGLTGTHGFSLQLQPIVSDVFGHYGLGIVLASNFVLVLSEGANGAVAVDETPYRISYFNPVTSAQVSIDLLYDSALPFQAALPAGQAITFTLLGTINGRYVAAQTATLTIAANTFVRMAVALQFQPLLPNAYSRRRRG